MQYARSEHSLSNTHIPIKADYALDGQFVSNWEDILLHNGYTKSSVLFLKSKVEFIAASYHTTLLITQYTANYIVQNLLLFFLHKLMQYYRSKLAQTKQHPQHSKTSTSAFSLFISSSICLILFGIAMFAVELSYMNKFRPNHPLVQGRLISIFVTIGSYTFFSVLHIICCNPSCRRNKSVCQNCFRCILFTLMKCVDYFFAFTITWIFISLYATLLLSLAYPKYIIILIILHVTSFIATTIIFATFVPCVKSCSNKCRHVFLRTVIHCCTAIGFVVLAVGIAALYVAAICAYGSTIVERIFPDNGLVEVLLILPYLIVILGAWLLQRNFFGKCSN